MSKTVAKTSRQTPLSLYARDGGRKYLNAAERQRLLDIIATLPPRRALFALVLAWTGARVSEVLALRPASFQIEDGIVALPTLKRRRYCVREVPLPSYLISALDQEFALRVSQRAPQEANGRLWRWHRVTAWRLVKDLMRDAGIHGASACPRGFRHGFGVGALQSGVPINLVQRWLGHSRLSTTAIYADASGHEERILAARFWQAMKPSLQ